MKTAGTNIFQLLKKDIQFIIPPYQRHYSWDKSPQCEQLWADIVAMHRHGKRAHFIGTVVSIVEDDDPVNVNKLSIIDGQQRLTTLTLLLIAMRDYLEGQNAEDKEAATIHRTMLRNEDSVCNTDTDHYKILPTVGDREVLTALINRDPLPKGLRSRLLDSYNYFRKQVQTGSLPPADIRAAMGKLTLVHITVKRNEDDPQAIFESLNSTGKALSQTDLIRNYLLMDLEPDAQEAVYKQFWRRMEQLFDDARQWGMDDFFRDFLIMKTARIPNKGQVYEKFKEHGNAGAKDDVKALCDELLRYATHYTAMRLCQSDDPELRGLYNDMLAVKMTVALPLLLRVHEDAAQGHITAEELREIIRLCVSYTYRRTICGLGTEGRNQLFARLTKSIRLDDYVKSIKAFFVLRDKTESFPSDEWFTRELATRDLYGLNVCAFTLTSLENYRNKTPIDPSTHTIEHIMPQNPNLSEAWRRDLGDDWQEVQQALLHTLGNLTLTGYNSELGDAPFVKKRDMEECGYKYNAPRLNKDVVAQEHWNAEAIKARAERLAKLAASVWPYPDLTEAELAPYRKPKGSETYDLDYYNMTPTAKELFDALDYSIRELSTNVQREPLKSYIAYRLDGASFADVQIQQRLLRVSLHMNRSDINDPESICSDRKSHGIGHGSVWVEMKSPADLPAVMAVIGQAYRKQAEE